MCNAALGGSGSTNETINEKGVSNEGHNKNRNNSLPDRIGNRYSTAKFKVKVEGM